MISDIKSKIQTWNLKRQYLVITRLLLTLKQKISIDTVVRYLNHNLIINCSSRTDRDQVLYKITLSWPANTILRTDLLDWILKHVKKPQLDTKSTTQQKKTNNTTKWQLKPVNTKTSWLFWHFPMRSTQQSLTLTERSIIFSLLLICFSVLISR